MVTLIKIYERHKKWQYSCILMGLEVVVRMMIFFSRMLVFSSTLAAYILHYHVIIF